MGFMTTRLMLLDSASLYFRAFYGVPDQREDPNAPPNNAIRGFLDMIATLVSAHRPTHLVACWDNDWRPAFRVEAIPSYKSHRVATEPTPVVVTDTPDQSHPATGEAEEVPGELAPQVPVIVDMLRALGIARIGSDGYEADDVIGTLAHAYKGRMPVDVVTGDRDLFQLVDDANEISVLYTARSGVRDAERVDEAFLRAKYDVVNGDAYRDMSVLRGDTSDGLPGVTGIGEKTAAKLIAAYGTLEGLRKAIDDGDPALKGAQRARLEAGAGYLDKAPRVVAVAKDAPVPSVDVAVPTAVVDAALMSKLASEFGLTNNVNRVLSALGI
jgi:5'-3' exonuclease